MKTSNNVIEGGADPMDIENIQLKKLTYAKHEKRMKE